MWPAVVNGTVVKCDTEMWKVLAEWSCSLSLLLISASTIAWIYPGQCAEDIFIILITLGKKRWWQQQLPDIWWSHWWPISPQGNQQSMEVPWMNADEVNRRTTKLNLVYIADPQNHKVANDHFRDYVSGWFFCKKSYMAHSVGSLLFSKNIKWKVSKYIYRNGQEKTEKTHKKFISILKILPPASRDKSKKSSYLSRLLYKPDWEYSLQHNQLELNIHLSGSRISFQLPRNSPFLRKTWYWLVLYQNKAVVAYQEPCHTRKKFFLLYGNQTWVRFLSFKEAKLLTSKKNFI